MTDPDGAQRTPSTEWVHRVSVTVSFILTEKTAQHAAFFSVFLIELCDGGSNGVWT